MEVEKPDLAHFQSIPWCNTLLSDSAFELTPTPSRIVKASTEDALFALTLKSPTTISHCLTQYKRPSRDYLLISEVRTFLELGPQLNGFPHVCHGGIVSAMLDEVMGILLVVNKNLPGGVIKEEAVTSSLNVKFEKPVRTPGAVVVGARLGERKGRRLEVVADVKDGTGKVLARGEAIWVEVDKARVNKL